MCFCLGWLSLAALWLADTDHVTNSDWRASHATEVLVHVGVVKSVLIKMDETKVIYHIDDEDTPYLVKLPKSPTDVTLSDFKNVLNRPSYKFFFKSMDDDFGWVVYLVCAVCRFISKPVFTLIFSLYSYFSSGTPLISKRVYICVVDREIRLFWKTLRSRSYAASF